MGHTHNIQFLWVPGVALESKLREDGIDTDDANDVRAYQDEVTQVETLREELRERAYAATGAIHSLPPLPGGPQLVERPVTSFQAGQRYVAWNIFAVAPDGVEIAVNKRMQNIAGGVLWAEAYRAPARRIEPPAENIAKGYRCENCRRFSYTSGQQWLTQETHRFEKSSAAMWTDILELIAENQDVEAPNSLDIFGACLEESKLIPKNFPGCVKYTPKLGVKLEGETCQTTTPGEERGAPRIGP